jgi:RNA polymerase sigma-70 factor (sigma-E family)
MLLRMEDQEAFLSAQQAPLTRAAYLLTGDKFTAQDLVQETSVRLLLHWRKVSQADVPEQYARRVLLNTFLSGKRRAWWREFPTAEPPDSASLEGSAVEDLDLLRRALLALPPRQRAAVVLRHYEDRSENETALLMGCSVGNVKALTSKGLAALRATLRGREHA